MTEPHIVSEPNPNTAVRPATIIDCTVIIGAGGTGGCLIPQLARLIKYHPAASYTGTNLQLWDGDEFEPHNLERQQCSEHQLDSNKAAVLASLCASLDLSIKPRPRFITEEDMQRAIQRHHSLLVVAAVDNNATRLMTLRALEAGKRDYFWVTPGNADNANGDSPIRGQVLWSGYINEQRYGLRVEDLLANYPELQDDEPMPRDGGCSHKAPSAPQLLTANMLAAAATLAVVQNLLDGTLGSTQHSSFFDAREGLRAATS